MIILFKRFVGFGCFKFIAVKILNYIIPTEVIGIKIENKFFFKKK